MCIHTADKLRERGPWTTEMCVTRDLDVITKKSADLALNPVVTVNRSENCESELVYLRLLLSLHVLPNKISTYQSCDLVPLYVTHDLHPVSVWPIGQ